MPKRTKPNSPPVQRNLAALPRGSAGGRGAVRREAPNSPPVQVQSNRAVLAVVAAAVTLSLSGCAAALWGNLLIVLLTLAIFLGTIRLGNGNEDR